MNTLETTPSIVSTGIESAQRLLTKLLESRPKINLPKYLYLVRRILLGGVTALTMASCIRPENQSPSKAAVYPEPYDNSHIEGMTYEKLNELNGLPFVTPQDVYDAVGMLPGDWPIGALVTVKSGDTISKFVNQYYQAGASLHVGQALIMGANNLSNSTIHVGQELYIPTFTGSSYEVDGRSLDTSGISTNNNEDAELLPTPTLNPSYSATQQAQGN